RPDLDVVDLRGNVPTRVRKVDEGQVHAAILAAAGLRRLDAHGRISAWLDALEGGCQVPIGALVMSDASGLVLYGLIADVDGRRVLRGNAPVDPDDPAASGTSLATELLRRGAADILAALRGLETVPAPQPE